ncbi:MAG: 50S ribosomal protein L29 [Anaerolineae bacterium]|nr:50S ribosomal protein L29 [Anaerolineae bacterium]NIN97904.1 50S ribosomal protein L29 [Anaerolineae bacterium]NIQ80883.1 50S ribosomal protein L29 [Anaerolineae bacterium]
MKTLDLRNMTSEELRHELENMYEELFNLRFQLSTNQLTNYNRIRQVKRDIARAKSILRERALAQTGEETS